MSVRSRIGGVLLVFAPSLSAAIGCNGSADGGPKIVYESSSPTTSWSDYAGTQGSTNGGAAAPLPAASSGATGGAGRSATPTPTPATTAGTRAPAPNTAGTSSAGTGSAGSPAAVGGGMGTVGPGSSGGTTASASNLSFDVTTSPVGYRYQPRNIGAIWVQDANGKLVKSLEVWASVRRRYLTRYTSALSGSAVDVTASATLSSHRAHHVTWNMTDKSGSAAPPGKYSLIMELTDGDQTGRNNTVPFDTSAGASSTTPADAPSFSGMRLQLQ